MTDMEIPVRTLFITDDIRNHFCGEVPRLLPVHYPDLLEGEEPHNVILGYEAPIAMPSEAALVEVMGTLWNGGDPDKMSQEARLFHDGLNGASSVIVSAPSRNMDSFVVHMGRSVAPLKVFTTEQTILGDNLTDAVKIYPFEGRDPAVPLCNPRECPVIVALGDRFIIPAAGECFAGQSGRISWAHVETTVRNVNLAKVVRENDFANFGYAGNQPAQAISVHHAVIPPTGSLIHRFGMAGMKFV